MDSEMKKAPSTPEHLEPIDSSQSNNAVEPIKKPWWHPIKEPGSAAQIVIAAVLAIAIGLIVTTQVDDVPESARVLLSIPGDLWLRSLKAVVLPLIICSMILAVQKLREISSGGALLAKWTVGYYVLTTIIAIILSCLMVGLVWGPMFREVSEEALAVSADDEYPDQRDNPIHNVVLQMFQSLIPENVVKSLASNDLLAILVTSVIVGYLIKGPDSSLLRAVIEVERITSVIITALIKLAPIGVFFLILPNLMKLKLADIGLNLGILIAGTLSTMGIHLFIILSGIFFAFTRMNPYTYWFKNASAWVTAWGSASSAATLPVTLRCARAMGIPVTVYKFAVPLGCLINMDGTAIYFPIAVVFLAATNGITLNVVDYIVITLLATLSSIGTTPIPSSSLVLTVMIAGSVNVPVTGMYAVIVAIDWFLDRFRTALNVSSDLFGAMVVYKITKIEDPEDMVDEDAPTMPREVEARV